LTEFYGSPHEAEARDVNATAGDRYPDRSTSDLIVSCSFWPY